ncbi:hypothetical protein D3C81_1973660 [compost metagenome]
MRGNDQQVPVAGVDAWVEDLHRAGATLAQQSQRPGGLPAAADGQPRWSARQLRESRAKPLRRTREQARRQPAPRCPGLQLQALLAAQA